MPRLGARPLGDCLQRTISGFCLQILAPHSSCASTPVLIRAPEWLPRCRIVLDLEAGKFYSVFNSLTSTPPQDCNAAKNPERLQFAQIVTNLFPKYRKKVARAKITEGPIGRNEMSCKNICKNIGGEAVELPWIADLNLLRSRCQHQNRPIWARKRSFAGGTIDTPDGCGHQRFTKSLQDARSSQYLFERARESARPCLFAGDRHRCPASRGRGCPGRPPAVDRARRP